MTHGPFDTGMACEQVKRPHARAAPKYMQNLVLLCNVQQDKAPSMIAGRWECLVTWEFTTGHARQQFPRPTRSRHCTTQDVRLSCQPESFCAHLFKPRKVMQRMATAAVAPAWRTLAPLHTVHNRD